MFAGIVVLSTFLALASSEFVRMEASVNTFSSTKWLKEKSMNEEATIKTIFVMKQNKLDGMEKLLKDVSSPSSAKYGQYLKSNEIIENFSPTYKELKLVLDFLATNGLTEDKIKVSKFQDLVHVEMPIKTAETILNTKFSIFRSVIQRDITVARITQPYYLPEEIAEVVSLVENVLRFPTIRASPRVYGAENQADDEFSSCGRQCSGFTTPDVLQSAYSYPTVETPAKGNSMAVAEFQFQYWDQADLDNFSDACGVSVSVAETYGGNIEGICKSGGCGEALLDIQYIGGVANPIPLSVYYSSTYSILDWIDSVLSTDEPPLVNSVSYSNDEADQTSVEYMDACNAKFITAGNMGISLFISSGDQGVWGRAGVGKTFNPEFPPSSPYVTSVGGTNFETKSEIGEETAWDCSGGGFSITFPQPSYQTDAVSNYLSTASSEGILPASSYFNSSGRGFPDIAALGGGTNPYCVSIDGGERFGGVYGTSASTPVVAGVFALLNDARLSAGKSSMGFVNPFIYENANCFHDVTDGSENNCAGKEGFASIAGWDPATGFGSPDYECLVAAALKI